MELYARSLYKIDCFKHAWLIPLQQGSTLTRSIRYLLEISRYIMKYIMYYLCSKEYTIYIEINVNVKLYGKCGVLRKNNAFYIHIITL